MLGITQKLLFQWLALFSVLSTAVYGNHQQSSNPRYGIDCSFPMQHLELQCGNLLGDRRTFYEKHIEGCVNTYSRDACEGFEVERLNMMKRQPQSMLVRPSD